MTKVHGSIQGKDKFARSPEALAALLVSQPSPMAMARLGGALAGRFVEWSRIGRRPRSDVAKVAHGNWGTAVLLNDGRWSIAGGTARIYRLESEGHRASKVGFRDSGLDACLALGLISYDDRIAWSKWTRAVAAKKRADEKMDSLQLDARDLGFKLVKLPKAKAAKK